MSAFQSGLRECAHLCRIWSLHGTKGGTVDQLDIARFWSNVEVGHYNACWPWRKGLNSNGYGEFKVDGKAVYAHRVAFLITAAMPLQDNTVIRHNCDNGACCNPVHLKSGTHADNVLDRVIRDRSAKGEANAKHKLTEDQVREIRQLTYQSASSVARLYGVTEGTIRAIWIGKTWKHVARR